VELLAVVGLIFAARLPLSSIKTYVKIIVPVIFIFFALFPLLEHHGNLLLSLGPLPITDLGISKGVVAGTRLGTLFFSTIGVLLTTTRERELVLGMTKMKLPYSIAFLLMISLRFITMSMADLETIRQARRARAMAEKENAFRLVKNMVSLVVPLFLATIRRIQIASNALEVKGFAVGAQRGSYYDEKLAPSEIAVLVAFVAVWVALATLRLVFGFFVAF